MLYFFFLLEVEPEEPCTKLGGVCAKGCEHSPYEEGLCPKQQKDGVQCCYRMWSLLLAIHQNINAIKFTDLEEKQCRSFGGECGDNCPKIGRNDLGCPTGKSCCIWLRKWWDFNDLFITFVIMCVSILFFLY